MTYKITVEDTESGETYTTECDGVAMLIDRGTEWGSGIINMSAQNMAGAMRADSRWDRALELKLALKDEDDGDDEDDEDDGDAPSGRCAATSPCQGRQEERGDDGDE